MSKEDIVEHQFQKGESGNPNGRPKKFVGAVLDELKAQGYENIKRSQIVDVYETLLVLPKDDLSIIGSSDEYPMIYRIVAKEMLSKRGFDIIERMLDRAQGKPTNRTEIGGSGGGAIPIALVRFVGEDKDNGEKSGSGNNGEEPERRDPIS